MKRPYFCVSFFILLSISISNCGSKKESTSEAEASAQATYASISKNIITPKCVSCHEHATSFSTYAKLTESTDRVNPGDASKSDLYLKIASDEMPQTGDPLSESEKNAIKTWINNGAKND